MNIILNNKLLRKRTLCCIFSLFIVLPLAAQDSLSMYTPEELGYKSSMATRNRTRPLLWKVYLDAMLKKKSTDSLKAETYYNLAFDIYRYTDFDLDFAIKLMGNAVYYMERTDDKAGLILCYDGLGSFYAMKNDNTNALYCINKIKKLHRQGIVDDISYLKFNESDIYLLIGDFDRAISILKKANKNIDEYISKHRGLYGEVRKGLVYDKKVNYISLLKCYNFKKELDSAAFYLKKIRELESNGFHYHNNYDWIEEAFYLVLKKEYDLAVQYIKLSENKGFIDSKDKRCRANYYLAICWEQKRDYVKSLRLCEEALLIRTKIPSFINYELELYKLAASNAFMLGNSKKEAFYLKKYNEVSQKTDYLGKSKLLARLYEHDVKEVRARLDSEKTKFIYLYCALFILILSLFYLILRYLNMRKSKKKFESLIIAYDNNILSEVFRNEDKTGIISENCHVAPLQKLDKRSIKISLQVDEKIVQQLTVFERNEQFLSPNISLSSMAGDFGTNSTYLSAVIRNYKKTNFNGYINDLRIEYIIKKLNTKPAYLNYKIAYLAEECGFSSHTVFVRIFTQRTGITPSKFISFLKSDSKAS